jgi:hypothetical protein
MPPKIEQLPGPQKIDSPQPGRPRTADTPQKKPISEEVGKKIERAEEKPPNEKVTKKMEEAGKESLSEEVREKVKGARIIFVGDSSTFTPNFLSGATFTLISPDGTATKVDEERPISLTDGAVVLATLAGGGVFAILSGEPSDKDKRVPNIKTEPVRKEQFVTHITHAEEVGVGGEEGSLKADTFSPFLCLGELDDGEKVHVGKIPGSMVNNITLVENRESICSVDNIYDIVTLNGGKEQTSYGNVAGFIIRGQHPTLILLVKVTGAVITSITGPGCELVRLTGRQAIIKIRAGENTWFTVRISKSDWSAKVSVWPQD